MATHSSILAWEIPWTEEPGGLQSMGFTKSGHVHIIYIYIYPLIKVWEFWFIGRKCWDSQWWSHFCFILTFRFVYCPIPLFLFQPTFSTSSVFYFRNTFLGLPWWSSGWDFAFWCTGCRFNLWPGVKIPHATQPKIQNIKWEQYCKKFNKDFKNGLHQKKNFTKKEIPSWTHSEIIFILPLP